MAALIERQNRKHDRDKRQLHRELSREREGTSRASRHNTLGVESPCFALARSAE
jgi:hypothetical protein